MNNIDIINESANKDIKKINSNLIIFIVHAIKYISLPIQNPDWIGSMKHSGKIIYWLKKDLPSVYKNFIIDYPSLYRDIMKEIWQDNQNKKASDFKYQEVINYFYNLDRITDINIVRKFLKDNMINSKNETRINTFSYD